MAYKTVRRNGRDVLINTITGKEVQPGERIANELKRFGSTINKNFTYSDKVNPRTGQRLTPAEVEAIEKPKVKVKNPVKSRQLAADEARTPKVEAGKGDPEFRRPKPAEKKPAKPVMRAAQQPTTATKAPAAKPKTPETRKPLSEMGSVSGSKFEGGPSANEKLTIGKTKYEGDVTPGVKADGTDMERRRAFLDADDSIKGMKAVRELLKKRKEAQRIKGG